MCFINCDAGQLALVVNGRKQFAEVLSRAELWCDVDEACVWVPALQIGFDALAFSIGSSRRNCFGWDTTGSGGIDLVCLYISLGERSQKGVNGWLTINAKRGETTTVTVRPSELSFQRDDPQRTATANDRGQLEA